MAQVGVSLTCVNPMIESWVEQQCNILTNLGGQHIEKFHICILLQKKTFPLSSFFQISLLKLAKET